MTKSSTILHVVKKTEICGYCVKFSTIPCLRKILSLHRKWENWKKENNDLSQNRLRIIDCFQKCKIFSLRILRKTCLMHEIQFFMKIHQFCTLCFNFSYAYHTNICSIMQKINHYHRKTLHLNWILKNRQKRKSHENCFDV